MADASVRELAHAVGGGLLILVVFWLGWAAAWLLELAVLGGGR